MLYMNARRWKGAWQCWGNFQIPNSNQIPKRISAEKGLHVEIKYIRLYKILQSLINTKHVFKKNIVDLFQPSFNVFCGYCIYTMTLTRHLMWPYFSSHVLLIYLYRSVEIIGCALRRWKDFIVLHIICWRFRRLFLGTAPVPVNWNIAVISLCFGIFNNVVHAAWSLVRCWITTTVVCTGYEYRKKA